MKTERNISDTAFRLFLGEGFSDISTNEIIRAAGATKGGFYYCFKSREDLAGKVIESYLRPYYLRPLEEMRGMGKQNGRTFPQRPCWGMLFLRRSVSADSRKTLVWILPFGRFTSCFMKA
ncbi:MAG: TetR/AcrR family transcriptional regulator [Anaerotignum sp.]